MVKGTERKLYLIGIIDECIRAKERSVEDMQEMASERGIHVSVSTIEKTMKLMKDMGAPIRYYRANTNPFKKNKFLPSHSEMHYEYTDPEWELALLFYSQEM